MASSEPNVLDSTPPVLSRHTKPFSRILSSSQSVLSPEDTPDELENPVDRSPAPRMGVASLKSRLS